ncbi:MAG: tRNA 2-thiocytidine biosynthesis TtcA family protein [Candidatus Edwardsbacteria bacterium]|nr:tRNA 2-thiocytidine biosynthesis TtcA family protein [Candidatus Edwardsbacteria bacterium]
MNHHKTRQTPPKPDNWGRIYPRAIRAEKDFCQIERGDRILIGLSGGSDSLVMLDILSQQHKKLGRSLGISIIAGHVPGEFQGKPIAPAKKLEKICSGLEVPFVASSSPLSDDIYNDCFKCSLARRRSLFDLAEEQGCNKIALGHNADDLVETALLNIMYSGKLAAILPRQPILKGKMHIIRPLAYVWKEEIVKYSFQRFGRIKTFSCPGTKGSRRLVIRRMLTRLQSGGSPVKENILKAISNPKLEYLPMIQNNRK